jgi:hypothetical protein
VAIRARVAWIDCCAKLKHGRLSLIDPEVATKNMLVKWIGKAFEGGKANLHTLTKYRLRGAHLDWGAMEL